MYSYTYRWTVSYDNLNTNSFCQSFLDNPKTLLTDLTVPSTNPLTNNFTNQPTNQPTPNPNVRQDTSQRGSRFPKDSTVKWSNLATDCASGFSQRKMVRFWLTGGFPTPLKNMRKSNWIISRGRDEHKTYKTYLKPPPGQFLTFVIWWPSFSYPKVMRDSTLREIFLTGGLLKIFVGRLGDMMHFFYTLYDVPLS